MSTTNAGAAGTVNNVSLSASSLTTGVPGVEYTVSFKVATALSGTGDTSGGSVTISVPGAVLPLCAGFEDMTTGQGPNNTCDQVHGSAGPTITLPVPNGDVVSAGDTVQVTFNGVTNTSTVGSNTLSVSTSSDAAGSTSYTTVANTGKVSEVTLSASSLTAGVSGVAYTVSLQVSATGALAGTGDTSGGSVTISVPGAVLPLCAGFEDMTTGQGPNNTCDQVHGSAGPTITLPVPNGDVVSAGDTVQVTFNGVTNTSTVGSNTLSVSTSSDAAGSTSYTTVANTGKVSDVKFSSSTSLAGLTASKATITFKVSATGSLVGNGGTISVSAPGAVLPLCAYVKDLTSQQGPDSSCDQNGTRGPAVTFTTPIDVNAGDSVSVTFSGMVLPSSKSFTLSMSTSSDATGTTTVTLKSHVHHKNVQ